MRLDHFDLNLLIAFDALMKERNVTRAAEQLSVTQSAMSAALKRLRESLQDEILVQHGKKMIPTVRALALAPEISSAIVHLRSLITSATAFDPETSIRRFRIAASDYISTVLIGPLLGSLQCEAPGITLEVSLPNTGSVKEMDNGDLDLLLTPEGFQSDYHPQDLLFAERHVVVGCADNPALVKELTYEAFHSCGHVVVQIEGRPTFIETVLARKDDYRRIEVIAPSFIQAPWMLKGTTRLALLHERLARLLAQPLGLKVAECPFELPVMREMMQYHTARKLDPGLEWLRNKLKKAAIGSDPNGSR